MVKYRIELEDLDDHCWSGTLEKNHGTEEQPEWWGVESYDGSLDSILNDAKGEVRRQEAEDGQGKAEAKS